MLDTLVNYAYYANIGNEINQADVIKLVDSLPDHALLTAVQLAAYTQETPTIWYRRIKLAQVGVKLGKTTRVTKRDFMRFIGR